MFNETAPAVEMKIDDESQTSLNEPNYTIMNKCTIDMQTSEIVKRIKSRRHLLFVQTVNTIITNNNNSE